MSYNRNVIIIEDQDSLREALAQMVNLAANHTVAGTFHSVASAMHAINSSKLSNSFVGCPFGQ